MAGIGPKMGPAEMPSVWTTYIASADADETASKIKSAGGQLLMEPFDVMDVGRMAIAADPAGAVFGVWQARSHTGVQLANEPGSLAWNENMSRDFDGNKAFYQAVFGYDLRRHELGRVPVRHAGPRWPARRRNRRARARFPAGDPGPLVGYFGRGRHRRGPGPGR